MKNSHSFFHGTSTKEYGARFQNTSNKKILLCLMPFWSPLIPPLGISALKSYLTQHGHNAVTYDFNTQNILWGPLNKYFRIIKESVPANKYGNFHMISYDVLSNHLMVFTHKTEDNKYNELIKTLIRKNFFVDIGMEVVSALDKVVSEFYTTLYKQVMKVFNAVKPDIFGVSAYSTSLAPSMFAMKIIKEQYPRVVTVMGGGVFADHLAPSSKNFSEFLKRTESYLDVAIAGEGEILFQKYLCGSLESGKRAYSIEDIMDENLELDSVDIPDFSDFELQNYVQMASYATRSCPFQCKFCSETVQWGRFRKKGIDQIVREIADIRKKYGGKLFLFGDSIINQIITELSHRLLQSGQHVYWDGYVRADPHVCDQANTRLWRSAGYYRARLGIESGSQHVLDLMNKKISVDQIKKALSALSSAGIKTTTYWIVGYPGETENDFQETLNLLAEIKNDIYEADWHPFYFYPQGQVSSRVWSREHGIESLYQEEFTDMLVTQTWVLKTNPSREEMYERLNSFSEACRKFKIANPYSLVEIYQADKRWKKLHPEAGPNIYELHNKIHSSES